MFGGTPSAQSDGHLNDADYFGCQIFSGELQRFGRGLLVRSEIFFSMAAMVSLDRLFLVERQPGLVRQKSAGH